MKKQIAFYFGWDIVFILFIYAYSSINRVIKDYTAKTLDVYPAIWIPIVLIILAGTIFAALVYISHKFKYTKKLSIYEFLIIGIPTFYIATAVAIPTLVSSLTVVGNIPYPTPTWLLLSSTPMIIGCIIFGYQLFMFIVRMIKFRSVDLPWKIFLSMLLLFCR